MGEFVPGYEASGFFGMGAPKGTPAEIVNKLNSEINAGLADRKLNERFADLGGVPMAMTPAEFGGLIADETEKWRKVIQAAKIKPECSSTIATRGSSRRNIRWCTSPGTRSHRIGGDCEPLAAPRTECPLTSDSIAARRFRGTPLEPWERVSSVIDVGSAQSSVPVRLALAHPHLTASGFDLLEVAPIFSRYVAAHNLSQRVRFIPGDFCQDGLPPADALIMGMILHDWDLPAKRMLLSKAYTSLPQGGTLIVREMLIDDERRAHLPGLLMSLNMLIETRGGFDFSGADCIGWMRDAGFSVARVVPLSSAYSAVIGTK